VADVEVHIGQQAVTFMGWRRPNHHGGQRRKERSQPAHDHRQGNDASPILWRVRQVMKLSWDVSFGSCKSRPSGAAGAELVLQNYILRPDLDSAPVWNG
jgi:hypothetical protein